MTPFGNCFSAGMCLKIEMRYMPTGSVLLVFFQNVMCCSRYATSKHKKLGGWNYVNMGKSRKENPQKLTQLSSRSHPRHLVGKRTAQESLFLLMVMYIFYASFSFCSQ